MFKYVFYKGEYIVFHGDALLDPGVVRMGTARSEHLAMLMVDALNAYKPRLGDRWWYQDVIDAINRS